tara:strand:+ start:5097 stop:5231 length:135 start_codon:yes stop_codon:yes gene_type:complete
MREIVAKYLKSPSPKLYAQLTSEEQRFVDRESAKDKKASRPPKE